MAKHTRKSNDKIAEEIQQATATTTMEPESDAGSTDGASEVLFPELDRDNAEHKALLRLAKSFHKKKVARDEMKSTAKADEDAAMEKLIAKMHEVGLTKFRHEGIEVNVISSKEKAQVKVADDDEDDEGEGDDE